LYHEKPIDKKVINIKEVDRMKEIGKLQERIKQLQIKTAVGLFALIIPSIDDGYEATCSLTKKGDKIDYKDASFFSRKEANNWVDSIINEYNIPDEKVTRVNIIGFNEECGADG